MSCEITYQNAYAKKVIFNMGLQLFGLGSQDLVQILRSIRNNQYAKETEMKFTAVKTLKIVLVFWTCLFTLLTWAEEDVAELEDYTVIDVTDDLSILPSEPSEGAFGLSLPLLETPRSVTEVSDDLVKTYALRSVDDLVRLTPGAFTNSFSVSGEPWIFEGSRPIITLEDLGG